MIIKDFKDGKLITLSKELDTRPKILNLIYSVVFFVSASYFLRLLLIGSLNTGGTIVSIIASTTLYLCTFKFGNRALLTEKLFINRKQLEFTKQGLFTYQKQSFDVSKISNFKYIPRPLLTKHPLSGDTFDYSGFQTEQQVINDMHGDNGISFDYNGKPVTFGNDLYLWDFESLEILLYDVTKNDFRYDDEYEKKFNSKNDTNHSNI